MEKEKITNPKAAGPKKASRVVKKTPTPVVDEAENKELEPDTGDPLEEGWTYILDKQNAEWVAYPEETAAAKMKYNGDNSNIKVRGSSSGRYMSMNKFVAENGHAPLPDHVAAHFEARAKRMAAAAAEKPGSKFDVRPTALSTNQEIKMYLSVREVPGYNPNWIYDRDQLMYFLKRAKH